jgi:hypothetical protein
MARKSLGELYCTAFKCAPEESTERILWQCLHWKALGLAKLIWLMRRDFFSADLELIRQAKDSTSTAELHSDVSDFRHSCRTGGLLRGLLRVRLSSGKLLELGSSLFPELTNLPPAENQAKPLRHNALPAANLPDRSIRPDCCSKPVSMPN